MDSGTEVDSGTDVVDAGGSSNGTPCTGADQCTSGYCVDGVCCDQSCSFFCFTCAAPGNVGTCAPVPVGTDPRGQCEDKGAASCGTDGACDGFGACRFYAQGLACGAATPVCNAASSAIVDSSVCDGSGSCVPNVLHDCDGYRCQDAACGTGPCTGDAACAPHAFCSVSACLAGPSNLAGNGDVEYGTTTGWFGFGGATTFGLSSTGSTGGFSHSGTNSVVAGGRTQLYQGPAYRLPTGPGRYTISVWAMQQADPSIVGLVQLQVNCNTGAQYVTVQGAGFGMPLSMGVWTQFTATVDTSSLPDDCLATATPPGVVRTVLLYLNQSGAGTPVAALYLDDLVVQVSDDHNLIGNPNFEAGVADGWTVADGGSIAVSTAVPANGGMNSLAVTARPSSTSGPRYALPLGPAKYNVTLHVLHNGTSAHDLVLRPSYTCLGGAQVIMTPIASEEAVPANTWTMLTGTVVLPPANATAGCKLIDADVHVEQEAGTCDTIECPDLFLDDAAITIAP
jgi:Carbohydrate binding domain